MQSVKLFSALLLMAVVALASFVSADLDKINCAQHEQGSESCTMCCDFIFRAMKVSDEFPVAPNSPCVCDHVKVLTGKPEPMKDYSYEY